MTWSGWGKNWGDDEHANLTYVTAYPDSRGIESWEQWYGSTDYLVGPWTFLGQNSLWAVNSTAASVAIALSDPHFAILAFQRGSPPRIHFTKSGDYDGFSGLYVNWTTPFVVAGAGGPTGPAPSGAPHVAIDPLQRIHLVYLRSDAAGRRDVYYVRNDGRGRDEGWTPEPGRLLSWTTADNHDAVIAASREGETVVVLWTATLAGGDEDLVFAYSVDGGATWSTATDLAATAFHEGYPAIAVDPVASSFHVAYWRDDSPIGHHNNILYTQAAWGDPATWTTPQSVVGTGAFVSDVYRRPTVASFWRDGTNHVVSVAWTDLREGDEDIHMADVDLFECSASASPSSGLAPLSVTFDATASGATSPYSYSWRFGDGANGGGSSVVHTYNTPRTYAASLQVTDAAGNMCFDGASIDVLSPMPDLAVFQSEIVLSAPPYLEGSPLAVHAPVHNLGGSDATNVTVRLALGGPTGPSLNDQVVPSVPVLQSASLSFPWTPASGGTFLLCIVADPTNRILESDEGNNMACVVVDVLALPDLSVDSSDVLLAPTPPVSIGTTVAIDALVRNLGTGTATDVVVRFTDGVPPGTPIGTDVLWPVLPPGPGPIANRTWTAGPAGAHQLCVAADPDNETAESDETNNVACVDVLVVSGTETRPDLTPFDARPVPPLRAGLSQRVDLSVQVRNVGNASAPNTLIAFYDAATPALLLGLSPVPPLAPSEASLRYVLPWTSPSVPGMVRIVAHVDYADSVPEWNETDNAFAWTIDALAGPVTDLVVGQPNVTAAQTYITSATALSFDVLDQSGTGIRNTTYRVDNGPWVNYTDNGPFTLSGEGAHLVEWYSVDFAGNVEDVASATLFVDDTPPTTTISIGDPKHLATSAYVTSQTTFALVAVDGGVLPVGVNGTEYRIDTEPWAPYAGAFVIVGEGTHGLVFRASDQLGNVEVTKVLPVVVDDTPPMTTLSLGDPKYLTGGRFVNASTSIALAAEDGGAVPVGLNRTTFRVWRGSWSQWATCAAPFALNGTDGTRYVEHRSVDLLGNAEAVRNDTLRLDNTPPATTLSPWEGPYTIATTFALSASDTGSGLNATEIRIDGSAWVPYSGGFLLAAGDHTIAYRSTDHLGNREPEWTREVHVAGPSPAIPNYKPLVAVIFAAVLAVAGLWSSRKRLWKNGTARKDMIAAFLVTSLPFVLAEAATGVASFYTGALRIPPILDVGAAVDLAILLAGCTAAAHRARRRTPLASNDSIARRT